ncbi:MAG: RecQ family ATP-dependent DNA helicase [Bacteroidetes bacterium]|nr:RecQ family ATP-dependent DNA helicase [Bacteroidota bacterium]
MTPNEVLKNYWGYDSFRPNQEEIIDNLISGRDTLALLPTGGGKSVCYQVPAILLDGVCFVVSPLIALMQDQVSGLMSKNIPAVYLHSAMERREVNTELENIRNGKYKLVYVSPERLQSKIFLESFNNTKVSFIAIDEAHCVSQWGYDFRPPYLEISALREYKKDIPFLALTASATPEVVKDISKQLTLRNPAFFSSGFSRKNLAYRVQYSEDIRVELLNTCRQSEGSGLIYANSRSLVVNLAQWLKSQGCSVSYYHAGLSGKERTLRQKEWIENRIRIMVCTNAFGMGVDKPDVRFVLHARAPLSLEAYYQEAGRAGRDGKDSVCVFYYNDGDLQISTDTLQNKYPDLKTIGRVYEQLCAFYQIALHSGEGASFLFDLELFCQRFDHKAVDVWNSLQQLEVLGYITYSEAIRNPSRIRFLMSSQVLYDFQLRNENLEPVIKLLLRSYGGILDHLTVVRENQLAERLKISNHSLAHLLNDLKERRVLEYYKSTDDPVITFVQPRVKSIVDKENRLAFLRETAFNRWRAVRKYLTCEYCRAIQISEYFGEKLKEDCGKCDICLAKFKNRISLNPKNDLQSELMGELQKGSLDYHKIFQMFAPEQKEDVEILMRWLVEQHVIKINIHNQVSLNR